MSPTRRVILLLVVALVMMTVVNPVGTAGAQSISGPTISLDRSEVAPGERVRLTVEGFTDRALVASVCGNEARRGSSDCNMPQSQGVTVDPTVDPMWITMPIAAPPVPCPCIVRVSNRTNSEFAIAPITLIGHPVGQLSEAPTIEDSIAADVAAEPAPRGLLDRVRTGLGGPSSYLVTITVRNRSTQVLSGLSVTGTSGRKSEEDLVILEPSAPAALQPGQTWQQTVPATLPALAWGWAEWRVVVSGAERTVTATDTTTRVPVLLLVFAAVFVVDVSAIAWRVVARRRRTSTNAEPDDIGPLSYPAWSDEAEPSPIRP